MLNEDYYEEERKVQTIFNVFSLIGGMISVVIISTRILLFWIQRSLFQLNILAEIFFTDNDVKKFEKEASMKSFNSSLKGIVPISTAGNTQTFKTDFEQ